MAVDLQLLVPQYKKYDELSFYAPPSILKLDQDNQLFEQIRKLPSVPIYPNYIISRVRKEKTKNYRNIVAGNIEEDDLGVPLRYVEAGTLVKNFDYNDIHGYSNQAAKAYLSTLPQDLHIILYWS